MLGRAGGILTDLHVDLQPSGWRLVDNPGRDERRAAALLTQDLDELAEAYDGYVGELKIQVAGPWTLAAGIRLNRGERVVSDLGAARDVGQALTDGIAGLVSRVRALVPGAGVIVQIDEPSLPAVLAGALRTSSGFGRLRSVDQATAAEPLDYLAARLSCEVAGLVLHCCAKDVPFDLMGRLASYELAIDTTLLGERGWDAIAARLDADLPTWLGVVPTTTSATHPGALVDAAWRASERVGIAPDVWRAARLTPACGLAGLTPANARAVQQLAIDAASLVADRLSGG